MAMTGAPRKAAIYILFFAEFSSCRATKFIIIRDNLSDDRVPNNETVYCSVSWYVIPSGPFGIPRLPWWDTSGPWKLVIGMFSSGQSSFRSLMHGSREDSGTKDVRAYYPFPFHASLRASLKWSMETTEARTGDQRVPPAPSQWLTYHFPRRVSSKVLPTFLPSFKVVLY